MRNVSELTAEPAVSGRPTGLRDPRRVVGLVLLLAVVAFVLVFPMTTRVGYLLSTGVVVLNFALMATGWNFMGGFTGYISLGHAAYFGLGAYSLAILIDRTGMSPFLALALAPLVVTLIAIPVGIAALRVRGASFVIVSIAFVLILLLVSQSWQSLTGGSTGLMIPRPFPDLIRTEHHQAFYYIYVLALIGALVVWWAIDRSRFGMGLKAVREDEDKARALGVPTFQAKLIAFAWSAFFTGLAGALYALWFGDLDPVFQFSILMGAYMVLMALLGGVRELFGPLLGAIVVGLAIEFFKAEFGDTQFHLVATGLLLALVVLFMPEGVIPAVKGLVTRFGPQASSIRELSAKDLLDGEDAADAAPAGSPTPTPGATTDREVPAEPADETRRTR